MKKIFESVLILIIFYGVYSIFDLLSKYIFKDVKNIIIIMISLVVSFLILLTYKLIISSSIKGDMKKHIDNLKTEIKRKEEEVIKVKDTNNDLIVSNNKLNDSR